jgi:hypothetical protein
MNHYYAGRLEVALAVGLGLLYAVGLALWL